MTYATQSIATDRFYIEAARKSLKATPQHLKHIWQDHIDRLQYNIEQTARNEAIYWESFR